MTQPQPQPLALPNYSSFGSIVTGDMDEYQAAEAVRNAGWRFAGDGAETMVYFSPSGDRVVKLTRRPASGNEATINAALEHPDNPHLPRVYGTLPLAFGCVAIETEVLERPHNSDTLSKEFRHTSRLSQFGEYGQHNVRKARTATNLMPKGPLKDAVKALELAALDLADETDNTYVWDIHGGNFMLRPATGEVVLNDTIYRSNY